MKKVICWTLAFLLTLTFHCGICNDLQDIFDEECGNAKVDLVLVIDSSGSVESVFNAYRDAAVDLVGMLPIGSDRTLLAVIQYNGLTYQKLEFSDDQSVKSVNKTVTELEWLGGTTQSAEAVDLGISAYRKGRPDASRMFVLMTDGNSYNTWKRVQETAERLHRTGAKIYIVALGDTMYEPELEAYAGPNGTIIKRIDFNKFKGEILDLTGFICHPVQRYLGLQLEGSSTAVPIVPSSLPSTAPPASSRSPSPAYPSPAAPATPYETQKPSKPPGSPPPAQDCAADILFILDSSGSVRNDFDRQIKFILDVIDSLTIDISAHLVALVEYAGEMRQRLQFSFTAYLKKDDLVSAIKALPFFSGTTATGEALKLGQHALGDRRKSVPALVFVLTDGFSQDDVSGPAAALRSEPNTQVYAVGVTLSVNTQDLLNIAGVSSHAFVNGDAAKIKTEVLPKYLSCGSATVPVPSSSNPPTTPPPPATTAPPVPTTTPGTTPPPPTTLAPTPPPPTNPPTTTPVQTTAPPTTTPAPTTSAPTTAKPTTPEPTTLPTTVPPTTIPPTTPSPTTPVPTTPAPTTTTTTTTTTTAAPTTTTTTAAPPTPAPTTAPPPPPPTTIPPTTPAPTTTTTAFISTGCLLDLFFVLDSSGSVAQTFRRELEFSASVVDRLVVGPQNARIGAVKYAGSGKARVIFPFDKYSNAEDVKNAILSTSFISGTTATNEALQLAAQEYDSSKGARPGEARYIVVVFTDGFSQDDVSSGAKLLQSKGATVYAIGVNSVHPVNRAELVEIAGDESRVFTDETIDSLYAALDHLEQACKEATGPGKGKYVPPQPPAKPPQPPPNSIPPSGPLGYETPAPRRYPPRLHALQ